MTQNKCPKCHINIGRSKFCGFCGTEGVEIERIKCECGETFDKDTEFYFCTECGRKLREKADVYKQFDEMCLGCGYTDKTCILPSRHINYETFKKTGKCPCFMKQKEAGK